MSSFSSFYIQQNKQYEQLHEEACQRGDFHYRDPETGYLVFTRIKHLHRGYCCQSGCRHCPYGFEQEHRETHE